MDTAQWPQGIGVVNNKPVENSSSCVNPSTEKKPRPQKEQALHCPRCSSTNTKFCYYNNYSLSQPRYFCKTCRRYWTEGGSLRNVPVGGGSRKNRRSSSSSLNSSKKVIIDNNLNPPPNYTPQNPKLHQVQDPSLAYSAAPPHQFNGISEFIPLPSFNALDVSNMNLQNPIGSSSDTSHRIPVMELLKTGNMGSRGLSSSSFLSFPVHNSNSSVYSSLGFPLHEQMKPSLSFSLDGFDLNGYGNAQGVDQGNANPSRNGQFPFEESSKPASNSEAFEQDRCEGNQPNGFNWNGMLTGGSW